MRCSMRAKLEKELPLCSWGRHFLFFYVSVSLQCFLFLLCPAFSTLPSSRSTSSHHPPGGLNASVGAFNVSVNLITQESLDTAQDRYVEVAEYIAFQVEAVFNASLPYEDSGNLNSCVPLKWAAYGPDGYAQAAYIDKSLSVSILSDGVELNSTLDVNFTVPVFVGGCPYQEFVYKFNQNPSAYPAVTAAITNAALSNLANAPLPNFDSGNLDCCCDPQWSIAGSQTARQPSTSSPLVLSLLSNGIQAQVSFSVNFQTPVWSGGCTQYSTCYCETFCPQGTMMTGSFDYTLTVQIQCITCPIYPNIPFNIPASVSTAYTNFQYQTNCQQIPDGYGEQLRDAMLGYVQNSISGTLNGNMAASSVTFCACEVTCPNPPSVIQGLFTLNLTADAHVAWDVDHIAVLSTPVTPNYTNWIMQTCSNSSDFYGYEEIARDAVIDETVAAISNYLVGQVNAYNQPVTFPAFSGYSIYIQYVIDYLSFNASNWIMSKFSSVIYGVMVDNSTVTFVDYDSDEALMWPPDSDWSPPIDLNPLLNALRISSTTLTGMAWVADELGYFAYGLNTTIIDANMLFNVTFTRPEFSIPAENVVQAILPFGYIYGTCQNPGHQNQTMVQFSFANLSALATLLFVSTPSPGYTLNVTSFDYTNTTIELDYPLIPIPYNILMDLLEDFMNDLIPQINDWLQFNEIILPASVSQELPSPLTNVYPQPGCCPGWSHGYLDISSYSVPETTIRTHLGSLNHSRDQIIVKESNILTKSDGVISLIVFSSWLNSNLECQLGGAGQYIEMALIAPNLDNPCLQLPFQFGVPLFYTLSSISNAGVHDLIITSDPRCISNGLNATSSLYGGCVSLMGNLSVLALPIEDSFSYATVPIASSSIVSNNSFELLFWVDQENCQVQENGYSGFSFPLNGTNSSTPVCASFIDDSYYSLGMINTTYTLMLFCDASCSNCMANTSFSLDVAGTCQIYNSSNGIFPFMIVPTNRIPMVQAFTLNSSHKIPLYVWILIGGGLILLLVVFVVTEMKLHWIEAIDCASYWHRIKRGVSSCCVKNCSPGIRCIYCFASVQDCCAAIGRGVLVVLAAIFYFFYYYLNVLGYQIKRLFRGIVHKFQNTEILYLLATSEDIMAFEHQKPIVYKTSLALISTTSLCFVCHFVLWFYNSPFSYFTSSAFSKVGLTSSYLSCPSLFSNFDLWSDVSSYIALGIAFILFLLAAGPIVMCRFFPYWHRACVFFLGFAALAHFASIIIPPFTFVFRDGFVLNATNTSYFGGNSSMKASIEEAIGVGFSGVAISFFANIFIFMLHSIAPGIFVAITLFWIQEVNYGSSKSIVSLNLQLGHIKALLWISQLIAPLAGCLGVIVVYQSLGTQLWWTILWGLLWVCPSFFLLSWNFLFQDYGMKSESSEQLWVSKRSGLYSISLWYRSVIYLAAYLLFIFSTLGLLIWGEAELRGLDVTFISSLSVTTFMLVLTLMYTTMHEKRIYDEIFLRLRLYPMKPISSSLETRPLLSHPFDDVPDRALSSSSVASAQNTHDPLDESFLNSLKSRLMNINESDNDAEPASMEEVYAAYDNKHIVIRMFMKFWFWLFEKKEQHWPEDYGKRLPRRRLFFILAVVLLAIYLRKSIDQDIHTSVFEEVRNLLAELNIDVVWPDNGKNTTIFQNLFDEYQQARTISDGTLVASWLILFVALIIDCLQLGRKWFDISRYLSFSAMVVMFSALIIPATPNYLKHTDFSAICPYCAPEFNQFVKSMVGDMVGLMTSGIFTFNFIVVLLAVAPAILRTSRLIFVDRHLQRIDNLSDPLSLALFKEHVRTFFAWGTLATPFLLCLPFLVFFQFFGDAFIAFWFSAFLVFPIFVGFTATKDTLSRNYFLWLLGYFVPLIAVLIFEAHLHGLAHAIVRVIRDPMTYVELICEITLANVVVSDIIYINMMF